MKAAVLHAFGSPLAVETVPDPVGGPGEVIVDVAAAGVLAYAGEVLSGQRRYLLELPAVFGSGAVGRVRSVGPDATRLKLGDWVYCDSTVRSRDNPANPDITLQGLSARDAGGVRLQRHWHDGSYAEQLRLPTENAIPLGEVDAGDAARWLALGRLLVPFGGLSEGRVEAGQTLVVSGATGAFGSAAVAVALALGVRQVVATGRNLAALDRLEEVYGGRVTGIAMTGDADADTAAICAAAAADIDCVFDILPPEARAVQARAAIMAVRPYGRVVLMGGVGMTGGDDLALPYPWIMRHCVTIHGVWMYRPDAVYRMIAMIRAGVVDLGRYDLTAFPLDRVNEAVAHAAANAGPFNLTVVEP